MPLQNSEIIFSFLKKCSKTNKYNFQNLRKNVLNFVKEKGRGEEIIFVLKM